MSENLHFSFLCPACQKQLEFKHEATSVIICNKCKAVVNKNDYQKSITTVSFFEEDMTTLQIGTTGKNNGNNKFEIIGRLKIEYEDGFYNLWCVKFVNTNTLSWIIDSMGCYSICEIDNTLSLNIKQLITKRAGHDFLIEKKGTFEIKKVYEIENYNAEGEFESIPLLLNNATFYEMCLKGTIIFCINYTNNQTITFSGKYYSYGSFVFENTRYSA